MRKRPAKITEEVASGAFALGWRKGLKVAFRPRPIIVINCIEDKN